MMDGLDGPPADRRGGAEQAVQAGVVDHPDDGRNAAALLADEPRPGAAELDLGGRQRAGAELVLETLELHPGPALDQEARDPRRRLSEDEEHRARRVRAEPLVPVQLVCVAPGRL